MKSLSSSDQLARRKDFIHNEQLISSVHATTAHSRCLKKKGQTKNTGSVTTSVGGIKLV